MMEKVFDNGGNIVLYKDVKPTEVICICDRNNNLIGIYHPEQYYDSEGNLCSLEDITMKVLTYSKD